ncbi:hypothetical protein [Rhizobium miluonense]|uniref:Uncharacterized protein n=1 Tax=Rhizobium miluonense TaxID=411945 RepID=A0A1C3XAB8_9HYPH|nr:hypothetical protein [Rhizobium miluonense]SCB49125.1 hypothetical protein GA0061102_107121 [Rhizobium miluonense]
MPNDRMSLSEWKHQQSLMTEEQRAMSRTLVDGMRELNDRILEAGALGLKIDVNPVHTFWPRAGGKVQLIDLSISVKAPTKSITEKTDTLAP